MGANEGVVGDGREGKDEGRCEADIVIVYAFFCSPTPFIPSIFEFGYVEVKEAVKGINDCFRSLVTSTSIVRVPEKAGMGSVGLAGFEL